MAALAYWESLPWETRNRAHAEYAWLMELQSQARANAATPYGPLGQSQQAATQSAETKSDTGAEPAREALVRYERRGARVRGLSLTADGTVQFQVKTNLPKGQVLTLETQEWSDERQRWVTVEDEITVEAGGVVKANTQVFVYNCVFVKDPRGKILVRITTA